MNQPVKKQLSCFVINNILELDKIVDFIKPLLLKKTCILLNGEMAAGKTSFVKSFCQSYNLENVTSPTFSLHHVYQNALITIDHFDLYRLNNSDEVETSGLWEALGKNDCLVLIEWPTKISTSSISLDCKLIELNFRKIDENTREVTLFTY